MANVVKRVAFQEGTGPRVVLYHCNDGGHNQNLQVMDDIPLNLGELIKVDFVAGYCDDEDIDVPVDINPNTIMFQVNEPALNTTQHSIWFLCLGTAKPGE